MNRFLSLLVATGLAAVAADLPSTSMPPDSVAGRRLVEERCASCHALEPSGDGGPLSMLHSAGPDLSYSGTKFRAGWLEAWLQAPQRIRPAGYLPFRYTVATPEGDRIYASRLPEHPRLSPREAQAAAAFLATLERPGNPYAASEPRPGLRPEVHFEKILPCGACHQVRPGKGGVSGPELYRARQRLDREWTLAFIADPPFWGRKPMPRVQVRSDLLVALGDLFFQPGDGGAGDGGAATSGPTAADDPDLGELVLDGQGPSPVPDGPGEGLYLMFCSPCHGVTGNGKGVNSSSMFVAPRDHTSFEEMSVLSDEHLFSTIKRGGTSVGKSALMPAWGGVLGDDEIRLLVAHLRRLSGTGS